MAQITFTPGVYTREFDVSFQSPRISQENILSLVGFTNKGPAFIPTLEDSFSNFSIDFGSYNTNYMLPYAAYQSLKNGTNVLVTRVLGTDSTLALNNYIPLVFSLTTTSGSDISSISGKIVSILRLRGNIAGTMTVGYTGSATSFSLAIAGVTLTGALSGYTASASGTVTGLSIDPTSANYIGRKLGTDPTTPKSSDLLTSVYVSNIFNWYNSSTTADVTTYGEAAYNGALSATTTVLASTANIITSSTDKTFGDFTNASTPYIVSQNYNGVVYDLFKLHTISDGNYSNKEFKVTISDITPPTTTVAAKFTVTLRTFIDPDGNVTDDDRSPIIVQQFRDVCLDKTAKNYIGRIIGDQYQTFNPTTGEITVAGDYKNNSKYVYVQVADNIPFDVVPSGFKSIEFLYPAAGKLPPQLPYKIDQLYQSSYNSSIMHGPDYDTYGKYLLDALTALPTSSNAKTTQKGLLIINTSESSASSSLSSSYVLVSLSTTGNSRLKQFNVPFYGGWDGIDPTTAISAQQTSLSGSINSAIQILSDRDLFDFDLFAMPGVTVQALNIKALTMIEERADAYFLMDVGAYNTGKTIITGSGYYGDFDSNYACGNWPWVKIYDSENDQHVTAPPSIPAIEALTFNDKVKYPWWAAAGLNRGIIESATDVIESLRAVDLVSFKNNKVNPIRKYKGKIVRFDQLTLQRKDSLLNNESIRRLLIKSRKLIAQVAIKYMFEPNTPTTWEKFLDEANPILEDIQKKQGLEKFVIVMDETTNTPERRDRNEMYAKILLQPTKPGSVFMIDFYISPSGGVTFNEL